MNEQKTYKQEKRSLSNTIARGGGIFGLGLFGNRMLQFLNTLIVVRIISQAYFIGTVIPSQFLKRPFYP